MVLKDKRNHCFFVCNLWPDFKKVKFDVRLSLEPFKDLDGRFDPSLTALTKRSQMLSNGTCVSRILSAGVWDRLWPRKGQLLRYTALLLYTQLFCKSTFLSSCSWIWVMNGATWPVNNFTIRTVTCRVSRKAKGSRSFKGVDSLSDSCHSRALLNLPTWKLSCY